VAFSGTVADKESGPGDFTETGPVLNPGLMGRDIREAFKGDDYQILLVANKFQTGFDQPLLCGMYVDKRLQFSMDNGQFAMIFPPSPGHHRIEHRPARGRVGDEGSNL
jgi:hypothetical protein